jgi:hypothetical protein
MKGGNEANDISVVSSATGSGIMRATIHAVIARFRRAIQ